tara:strand:+ start:3124 stop:3360 length:237 start_codon:yes stop_codon:yes gene_type:complete
VKVRLLFFILLASCVTNKKTPKEPCCKHADALDTAPNILHWETASDGTLHIYTEKDSIIDERARWDYIRSLDHDSLWE